MIIKTAIALVLTASLAGGAVFFGTQDDAEQNGEVALAEHPHKQADTSHDTENVDIEASQKTDSETSNVSPIDRLLNRNSETETAVTESEQSDPSVTTITEKTVTVTETIEDTEASVREEIEVSQQVEEEQDVQTVETMDAQESIQSSSDAILSDNNFAEMNEKDEFVELVLQKIDKIKSTEIKDQAYFDLMGYALDNQMYSRASSVISGIENPTFRDKARGEYALGLIADGQISGAFEVLEAVETDDLKDVLRLKAIQALIGHQSGQ